MQYLLQSVGIVSADVTSEQAPDGGYHAFNMVKIGKYTYYLDATWGDSSNTMTGDKNKNAIDYNYCCVPYDDFVAVGEGNSPEYHMPNGEMYPDLHKMQYTRHEYYRYHNAFVETYNREQMIKIFMNQATKYNPDEMGDFTLSFRCKNASITKLVKSKLFGTGEVYEVLRIAASRVKSKKAAELLKFGTCSYKIQGNVIAIYPPEKPKKKQK